MEDGAMRYILSLTTEVSVQLRKLPWGTHRFTIPHLAYKTILFHR